MAKFSLKNSLTASRTDENGLQWYECATYTEVKEYMDSNIERTKGFYLKIEENFVEMGYWLKYINENKMYEQDGFNSIWDFAQANYEMSKSTALRLMQINSEFSVDGNTPVIDDRYKNYSKSQLQEILYLTSEQREEVSPEMTVTEIREIKKQNQPDDETIRTFAKEKLCGHIEKQNYADTKALKDYLYNRFGKSHAGYCSDTLQYNSDPKGIIFNDLAETPNDKITWSALAKRIIELYNSDPLTLELPEVLEGQMEIVNVDMEVEEYRGADYNPIAMDDEELNEEKEEEVIEEVQESICKACIHDEECVEMKTDQQSNECLAYEESIEEEVLTILSYTRGNAMDSIPFMNEQDLFIHSNGQKCTLTMKLQKYIAEQVSMLNLDKYRFEIRAVKIK